MLIGQNSQIAPMARKLVEERDYCCVSVEKLIEQHMQGSPSEQDKTAWENKTDLDSGVVEGLVEKALSSAGPKVVLCNYPRSEQQA